MPTILMILGALKITYLEISTKKERSCFLFFISAPDLSNTLLCNKVDKKEGKYD
jgi:hypothetical protein